MIDPQWTVARWTADEVLARQDELRELSASAYAEPPYDKGPADADRFLVRLADQTQAQGFSFVTACAGVVPVGFAFGRHFGHGQWWHGGEIFPDVVLMRAQKFAVSELVVAPGHRNQGVSGRLMAELLRDRPEPYAILLSRPGSRARVIYEHWGWQWVGTVRVSPDHPANDALILPLP